MFRIAFQSGITCLRSVFPFALFFFAALRPCQGEDAPDARLILRSVRLSETAQNRTLKGSLRMAGKTVPFRMTSSTGSIRYEFTDPPLILQLRLGATESRMEEVTKGKVEKVTPAKYDTAVRGMGITYEDLSLHFLYWQKASVTGEETMMFQNCWIVRVLPDSPKDSQYGAVMLWISKANGALLQAAAYGKDGNLLRKFKVISGQKTPEGLWILKEMRIESMTGGPGDHITHLQIEGEEK